MPQLETLKSILANMQSVLVAYSGGVDSTFLLKIAQDTCPHLLAVIARSETYPEREVTAAEKTARQLGVKYRIIKTAEFADENFASNPKERCYFCKKELFSKLWQLARKTKLNYVVDGSNYDDLSDFRPGSKAAKELGVRSPLQEAKLRKSEIRDLSQKLGLKTWDKPSLACLASRIPYHTKIDKETLQKINAAEEFILNLGFQQVRVRHHGQIARIELPKSDLISVLAADLHEEISKKLKSLGYTYITLDLAGYRSGSMNEIF